MLSFQWEIWLLNFKGKVNNSFIEICINWPYWKAWGPYVICFIFIYSYVVWQYWIIFLYKKLYFKQYIIVSYLLRKMTYNLRFYFCKLQLFHYYGFHIQKLLHYYNLQYLQMMNHQWDILHLKYNHFIQNLNSIEIKCELFHAIVNIFFTPISPMNLSYNFFFFQTFNVISYLVSVSRRNVHC